ncbi:hypothetical protein TcWFU_003191 [Taenia crassiceps]|uniref:Uncharacterized protein n=1 Tax=Taenia crassiceps TaxID=6207 RepID=A0ABR4QAQ7_9CEST
MSNLCWEGKVEENNGTSDASLTTHDGDNGDDAGRSFKGRPDTGEERAMVPVYLSYDRLSLCSLFGRIRLAQREVVQLHSSMGRKKSSKLLLSDTMTDFSIDRSEIAKAQRPSTMSGSGENCDKSVGGQGTLTL